MQPDSLTQDAKPPDDPEPPSTIPSEAEIDKFGRAHRYLHSGIVAPSTAIIRNYEKTPFHRTGIFFHSHRFISSSNSKKFRKKFFPHVSAVEWNDWRWQIRNRIKDVETLEKMLELSDRELAALKRPNGALPVAITPYFTSLINPVNPSHPLRRTVIPVIDESFHSEGEKRDPLGEEGHSRVPCLVHRYPDRVLFLTTGFCSTYCRYCTRSRMVGDSSHAHFGPKQWERALTYIRNTPAVRDVLLSGGDPLTLSNHALEWLLSRLRRIQHVEFLRIGTKVPVVLPQRITPELIRILRRYHPLWMSIHFSHPEELTPETHKACTRLADAGIPLGSQTVLLKGINDDVETMKTLVHGLIRMRVRPYYLYQCDPIIGSSHFRTSVSKGLEIIKGLRGYTSGYAVPHYVIDAPGGGGKIPLLPDYVAGRDGDNLLLRNYEGAIFRYPDYSGRLVGGNYTIQ